MVSWESFINAPGSVIDAARLRTVTIARHGKPFATVRRVTGGEPFLSVTELQRKRRSVVAAMIDGQPVRFGRYGTVEAVVEGIKS